MTVKANAYRPALFYTTRATRLAFVGLGLTTMLQFLLITQAWIVLSGALAMAAFAVLVLLILLSNLTAGFIFAEMSHDSDQYRPRFARAAGMHGLLTAGFSSTMLIQVMAEASRTPLPPLLDVSVGVKLMITFVPLLVLSHAGAYVLVNTQPNHPYYTDKYGYPVVQKRKKNRERATRQ